MLSVDDNEHIDDNSSIQKSVCKWFIRLIFLLSQGDEVILMQPRIQKLNWNLKHDELVEEVDQHSRDKYINKIHEVFVLSPILVVMKRISIDLFPDLDTSFWIAQRFLQWSDEENVKEWEFEMVADE